MFAYGRLTRVGILHLHHPLHTTLGSWTDGRIHVGIGRAVGADLGFYKGGCSIHLKGAPEVERRRHRGGEVWGRGLCPLPKIFCIFYVKLVSFYAFSVIFIDIVLFIKGT